MSTDQQWDIVTGVGLTALAVAAARAAESTRPDALISDPYASRLVAAAKAPVPFPFPDGAAGAQGADMGDTSTGDTSTGETGTGDAGTGDTGKRDTDTAGPAGDEELWRGTTDYIGLRSRVFDDFFRRTSQEGVTQVVILASGLDTRPYRLSWPAGTVCYELDQPAVLAFKAETLAEEGATPGCDHRPVPVDLRDDWGAALESAGFDASRPTAWLAEGLLPYLPPEAEVRLLQEVSRLSATGSRFAVERIDNVAQVLDDEVLRERSEAMGLDVLSLLPQGERSPVEGQLTRLGWELEHRTVPVSSAELGRPTPVLSMFTDNVTHTFGLLA